MHVVRVERVAALGTAMHDLWIRLFLDAPLELARGLPVFAPTVKRTVSILLVCFGSVTHFQHQPYRLKSCMKPGSDGPLLRRWHDSNGSPAVRCDRTSVLAKFVHVRISSTHQQ